MRSVTSEEQAVDIAAEVLEAIRKSQGEPKAAGIRHRARQIVAAIKAAGLLADNDRPTLESLDCPEARAGGVWETTMLTGPNPWLVWYRAGQWHTDFGDPSQDRCIGEMQLPWLLVGRGPYIKLR